MVDISNTVTTLDYAGTATTLGLTPVQVTPPTTTLATGLEYASDIDHQ